MIDIICTQRIHPGMEAYRGAAVESRDGNPANDKGGERYEWYRGEEPNTS